MLDKTHITNIPILSEDWRAGRLAKFTASEIHLLMGEKPFTQGAMSYIYRKLGEELSGLVCRDEVDTVATEHGKKFESQAIIEIGKVLNLDFVITQKLVTAQGSRFGCTPDFLILHGESIDKKFWNVSTGEVKCPYSYDSYIGLARCRTPADVKKENKNYYWQVLDQMDNCNCIYGYFGIYHPYFKIGNLNIIKFRKLMLKDDFALLKQRKQMAVEKFNEIREEMFNLKYDPNDVIKNAII